MDGDMLQRWKTRAQDEDGFTLVELMTVLVILSALVLLSLGTFLGARSRSQDSAAKQGAAKALETARIVFTDSASYSGVIPGDLTVAEPSMRFVDGATSSGTSLTASTDVSDPTGHTFIAAVYSEAGKCFFIRDWTTIGIGYAVDPDATPADCKASDTSGAGAFSGRWPST
jgi:prepilin-type N-terminal cleavage/methylation domain-containing protein